MLIILCIILFVIALAGFASYGWMPARSEKSAKPIDELRVPRNKFKPYDFQIWDKLHADIEKGNYGKIHSVLVMSGETLIIEKYYNKWEKDKIHDVQSVTKSIMSLLIGIAIDKGFIRSVDQKLQKLLSRSHFKESHRLTGSITLKNLLTMSEGLAWQEQQVKYNTPGNSLTDMYAQQKNWIEYILGLPVIRKPGSGFNYNSGVSILLGCILQENTGMSVKKFAETYLFAPLDITKYHWEEYFGVAHGGGGLFLNSMDMARIGKLCLDGGRWEQEQVIQEQWIRECFKPRFRSGARISYGYQWWMIDPVFHFDPVPYAAGNGWQFIFVLKEFDMVVVVTGHNYVEVELKTSLSQNELLYCILSGNPLYQEKIIAAYGNISPAKQLEFYEVLVMAVSLNCQAEFSKTVAFLQMFEEKHKNDLRFNYLLGEAYGGLGNIESAKVYLKKCQELCIANAYPDAGYCRKAGDILAGYEVV